MGEKLGPEAENQLLSGIGPQDGTADRKELPQHGNYQQKDSNEAEPSQGGMGDGCRQLALQESGKRTRADHAVYRDFQRQGTEKRKRRRQQAEPEQTHGVDPAWPRLKQEPPAKRNIGVFSHFYFHASSTTP